MRLFRTGTGFDLAVRRSRPAWLASTTTLYAVGFVVTAGALLALMTQSFAQEVEWEGGISNAWHTGSNWDGNAEPGAANDVVIDETGFFESDPVLSGAPATVQSLVVNPDGDLTIRGTSLDATNGVTVEGVNSFFNGRGQITIENNGSLTSSNGEVNIVGGLITVESGGAINDTVNVQNSSSISGRLENYGTINGSVNTDEGTVGGQNARFHNHAGGVLNGVLINKGEAENFAADNGLAAGRISEVQNSGTFTNEGLITGNLGNSGTGTSTNRGTIGGATNITGGRVDNEGTLTGRATVAGGELWNTNSIQNGVDVSAFGKFYNQSGGNMQGILDNEGIAQNFAGGTLASVENSGSFTNEGLTTGNLGNSGTGTSTNRGTIGGATNITGGRVDNEGTLTGRATVAGGELWNTNSIQNGVDVSAFGKFYNQSGGNMQGILDNEGIAQNFAGGTLASVENSGSFTNEGLTTGNLGNSGTGTSTNRGTIGGATNITGGRVDNEGTLTGRATVAGGELWNTNSIQNGVDVSAFGKFYNQSGGNMQGILDNEGIAQNFAGGTLASVENSGSFTNDGLVTLDVSNSATLINNNAINGNLINAGGTTTNNGQVSGATTITGGRVNNERTDTLTGTLTGLVTVTDGLLSNAGIVANGVTVGLDGEFYNQTTGQVSGLLQNSGTAQNLAGGTLQSVQNSGSFVNNGQVNGNLSNSSGRTTNTGQIAGTTDVTGGEVENTAAGTLGGLVNVEEAGLLTSMGTLGGLNNLGTARLSGTVNGSIFNGPNNSETTGRFELTGPLTVSGKFDNVGLFVSAQNGTITGLTQFDNQGIIAVNGSLGIGAVGAVNNTGTIAVGRLPDGTLIAPGVLEIEAQQFTNSSNIAVNGAINAQAETFNNSGTIKMADGDLDDRINLTGDLVHNGVIEVDINLSGRNDNNEQLADFIKVSGTTYGNGVIHFNDHRGLGGSGSLLIQLSLSMVQAAARIRITRLSICRSPVV